MLKEHVLPELCHPKKKGVGSPFSDWSDLHSYWDGLVQSLVVNLVSNPLPLIILGVVTLVLIFLVFEIKEKFKIPDTHFLFSKLINLLILSFVVCLLGTLLSGFLAWATQPSGFQKCMGDVNSQNWTDEQIAWKEDYCREIQAG